MTHRLSLYMDERSKVRMASPPSPPSPPSTPRQVPVTETKALPEVSVHYIVLPGDAESITLLNQVPEFMGSPDDVCPVCRQGVTDRVVALYCFHFLCSSCLQEWGRSNEAQARLCPVCRTRIQRVNHHILSNTVFETSTLGEFLQPRDDNSRIHLENQSADDGIRTDYPRFSGGPHNLNDNLDDDDDDVNPNRIARPRI